MEQNFNPLADITTELPGALQPVEGINLRALTPLNRALLVIDGTVTKFLEAYTLEPVEITRLSHEERLLPEACQWLDVPRGARVAERVVTIAGRYSRKLYVYAVSSVVLDRLPPEAATELKADGEGIGRLLNRHGLETRREVLCFGKQRSLDLPRSLDEYREEEFISRTYRIIRKGRPVALIKECFPAAPDLLPAHH